MTSAQLVVVPSLDHSGALMDRARPKHQAESQFGDGDVIVLKGSPHHQMVLCPPPEGAVTKPGWHWAARTNDAGIIFHLVPYAAIERIA